MRADFSTLTWAAVGLLCLSSAGTAGQPGAQATLWHGGTILTMEGEAPHTVEAVVTRAGRIVYTGPMAQARRVAGRGASDHNLKGATMLPGFVDAHSHFAMAAQMASGADLGDPDRPAGDIAAVIEALRKDASERQVPTGGWVIGWRYNEASLAEKRHITRADLDTAFPDRKVVLIHFTGHGLVANSAALEAGGVTDATQAPPGGLILRDAQGRPNGVLFEQAMMLVVLKIPQPTAEQKLAALEKAQQIYTRSGYTLVQDGATQPPDLAFLTSPAAVSRLKIDLTLLPYYAGLDGLLARKDVRFGAWQGRIKLQGVKFVLDGSPQARTAHMARDYALGSPEGHHPWHGQANMSEAEFIDKARKVTDRGWQLFVHANGDAAIDVAIRGFEALGIRAKDNRRPVVIHSQLQRPDHLRGYARIGVAPAYFSNHTYYFADIHRSNFGKEMVGFISPFQSARAAGLVASNHSDFPVTPLDPFTQLWSSMARTSLSGVVSGPEQRLSAYQALQALTTGPAWQAFEENRRGRIKVGLLADFVVLDHNPLAISTDEVRRIKVLETVKEGQTIWKIS
jgi:predicted amidohydrolase YtcJ